MPELVTGVVSVYIKHAAPADAEGFAPALRLGRFLRPSCAGEVRVGEVRAGEVRAGEVRVDAGARW